MLSLYYRDKETGKAYASHRDAFDSATGRFNQFDPLGVRVGVNGYLYVSAAPLRYEDPEGLFSLNAFFQGGAGAGFQVLFAGLNFNCGAAISTGLQRCAYCTVCVRLGPGLFIGGGGVAGGGVVNGNTQNLAGY